ncbi:MAG TPA: serine hydrolase [Rhizomicrobium sp.]|jgi:CubicO group peptidase (beta-lactamase class C family)|nr:serine hydrolase [Rhizomicrobium sp.]
MRRAMIVGAVLCAVAAAWAADAPKDLSSILFWTPQQQEAGYRAIENHFPTRLVKHGAGVYPLASATQAFDVAYDYQGASWNTDKFLSANRVSGLLVITDGRIVLERYALGRRESDRWISFSVSKSVTSMLIGAAIRDGAIRSLDAAVTDYVPGLKGSAYEGVTLRQLLTMTSGVKWNENYADPKSDVALFAQGAPGPDGESPIVAYMAKLPREAPPGSKFVYKTGESDLLGIVLEHATHKHLADYLSQKIWSKFGMESDAVWMDDSGGHEIGGCCIAMTLRDYGRFGLFVMNGGMAGGEQVVPPDYLSAATSKQVDIGDPTAGYGYQWWTVQGGIYQALGIFGQSITVVPSEHLVIVINSAWPTAETGALFNAEVAYMQAVGKALHTAPSSATAPP